MRLHGSLAQELIQLGYEPDDSWLESLQGVEPDHRPGVQSGRWSPRRAFTWYALVLRYVLWRRLGYFR